MVLPPGEQQHAPSWNASYVPGTVLNTFLSPWRSFSCDHEERFESWRVAPLQRQETRAQKGQVLAKGHREKVAKSGFQLRSV